jgi:hypothetical protein
VHKCDSSKSPFLNFSSSSSESLRPDDTVKPNANRRSERPRRASVKTMKESEDEDEQDWSDEEDEPDEQYTGRSKSSTNKASSKPSTAQNAAYMAACDKKTTKHVKGCRT